MKLFGGAIITDIPGDLQDASDLREVPDNQEVYVGTFRDTDVCVIVELMEPVPETDLISALAHHVEEAHRLSGVKNIVKDEPTEFFSARLGRHEFVGRSDDVETDTNSIFITFGLFRLKQFDVDVIVTCVVTCDKGSHISSQARDTQKSCVLQIVDTFHVADPNLFINEEKQIEEHQHAQEHQ